MRIIKETHVEELFRLVHVKLENVGDVVELILERLFELGGDQAPVTRHPTAHTHWRRSSVTKSVGERGTVACSVERGGGGDDEWLVNQSW